MLTMQIAQEVLSEFEPACKINDGTKMLSGMRLGQQQRDDCACVYASGSNIVCQHAEDKITVKGSSLEEVLGCLLDASDRISQWQVSMASLTQDSSIDAMVECTSSLLENPVMIVDARSMMCSSAAPSLEGAPEDWQYAQLNGRLPWSGLDFLKRSLPINTKLASKEDASFLAEYDNTGVNCAICRISGEENAFLGYMFVLELQRKLGQGTLQLMNMATQSVKQWIVMHRGEGNMFARQDFLVSLAMGERASKEQIAEQSHIMGVNSEECVMVRIMHPHNRTLAWAAATFQSVVPNSWCFELRGNLFALCESYNGLENDLKELATRDSFRFGLSWRFSDWNLIGEAINQTEVALSYTAAPVAVLDSHCVLFYIFSILTSSTRNIEITHPAIEFLEEYDDEHNSEYLRTLWLYLRHERNLVKTAQDLDIHRNSLVYRVRRIEELLPDVDFDDPETREHLMMSFRLRALQDRI